MEAASMLTPSASIEDTAAFLASALPEAWAAAAADAARANSVTAADLLNATEDAAARMLGVGVFGRKRKISMLLQQVKEENAKAPSPAAADPTAAAATAADSTSAAAAGSSSSASSSAAAAAAAPPPSSPAVDTRALDAATCEAQLGDEAHALGAISWVGNRLHSMLTKPQHAAWTTAPQKAARLQELEKLRSQCELPGVSVVVVGNTGAGKSTLLNALLGEASILPTNGMRACTACLIEMRYDDEDSAKQAAGGSGSGSNGFGGAGIGAASSSDGAIGGDRSGQSGPPLYRAEVEFLTAAEWDKEMADLLDDLTPNDGTNAGRVNLSVSEDHVSYGSWCKLYAVYGDEFTHSRVRTDRRGPGDRVLYDNPTLPDLTAKLRRTRSITHALSTVATVSASEPKAFRRKCERYMDSTRDVHGGSYWPIVKQVKLYSRAWKALETGAVLIDAPGVHDDNSARDAVVKQSLKRADAIWIVSNIVRAVNDKTAKDLLGQQFRRQLLMDGQFDSLAFIATQSDVIERREAARALGLPNTASLKECAAARNAFTVRRLRSDFQSGLREMARDAGEDASRSESLAKQHTLPIFTVSSVEYQKLSGLRPADGDARVWSAIEDTQIPPLVRHLQRAALRRRKELSLRRCEAMKDYTTSLLALLKHEERMPDAQRTAAKQCFDEQAATLRSSLTSAGNLAEKKIQSSFDDDVAPQLKAGADQARADAMETMQQWGLPNTQGGMHWATYKATTRRNGVFRLNMNEALVEPIFKAVSTQWERSFISGLNATLDALQTDVETAQAAFHPALMAALSAKGVPASAATGVSENSQSGQLINALRATIAKIKESVQSQQRELSRSMEPIVQTHMTPGYAEATAEAGTGSHRRRVAKLEAHLGSAAPKMFAAATEAVTSQMAELSKTIGSTLDKDVATAATSNLRTAYSPLWDEVGESVVAARRALAPLCAEVLLEANNAVKRLTSSSSSKGGGAGAASGKAREGSRHAEGGKGRAGSGGAGSVGNAGGSGGGGGDDAADDDDVVDVTDAQQSAKRARLAEAAIDLDDMDDDEAMMENAAPQTASTEGAAAGNSNMAPLSGKVKAEVKPEQQA